MFGIIKKAILVSRPAAWPFAAVVYAIGVFASGRTLDAFNILQIILLTFPLSFFVCGINDIYDMRTDSINKRKGTKLWGAIVNKQDVGWIRNGALIAAAAIMASAFFSGNAVHVVFTGLFLAISYFYSAPPLRMKSVPVADSVISGVGAFSVFVMGYSLSDSFGFLNPELALFFATASAAHAIGTIMDFSEDKAAGIRTFATAFGPRVPAIFAASVMFVNIPFAFRIMTSVGGVLFVIAALSAYLAIKPTQENAKKTMRYMLILFILWTVYAIFAVSLGIERINLIL